MQPRTQYTAVGVNHVTLTSGQCNTCHAVPQSSGIGQAPNHVPTIANSAGMAALTSSSPLARHSRNMRRHLTPSPAATAAAGTTCATSWRWSTSPPLPCTRKGWRHTLACSRRGLLKVSLHEQQPDLIPGVQQCTAAPRTVRAVISTAQCAVVDDSWTRLMPNIMAAHANITAPAGAATAIASARLPRAWNAAVVSPSADWAAEPRQAPTRWTARVGGTNLTCTAALLPDFGRIRTAHVQHLKLSQRPIY